MRIEGKAHCFGDSINTDYIISGRYKFRIQDPRELSRHLMEDIRPHFYRTISKGDFIVAGKNFGCGSSREQAPLAIKYAGISAVMAESFARIFFRNAINVGLLLIECATGSISEADTLEVDTSQGIVKDLTTGKAVEARPLPSFMTQIIRDGGIISHLRKHKGFRFSSEK